MCVCVCVHVHKLKSSWYFYVSFVFHGRVLTALKWHFASLDSWVSCHVLVSAVLWRPKWQRDTAEGSPAWFQCELILPIFQATTSVGGHPSLLGALLVFDLSVYPRSLSHLGLWNGLGYHLFWALPHFHSELKILVKSHFCPSGYEMFTFRLRRIPNGGQIRTERSWRVCPIYSNGNFLQRWNSRHVTF